MLEEGTADIELRVGPENVKLSKQKNDFGHFYCNVISNCVLTGGEQFDKQNYQFNF